MSASRKSIRGPRQVENRRGHKSYVESGFYKVKANRQLTLAGPPVYVSDTRYSRRVRLQFTFAAATPQAQITFANLLTATGLTGFTRLLVTRIDAWGVEQHSTETFSPVVAVQTTMPIPGGTTVVLDRNFSDQGVAGGSPAHVAVVPHGTILPYPNTVTAGIIFVPNPLTIGSGTGALVVVDVHCTFYESTVTTRFDIGSDGRLVVPSLPERDPELDEGSVTDLLLQPPMSAV